MKTRSKRFLVVLAICAMFTLVFLAGYRKGIPPLPELESFSQDLRARIGRWNPVDTNLVLIGIDRPVYDSAFSQDELEREPVLAELQKPFPWSRAVWARLVEKLAGAGARVIAIDLIFAAPGPGDEQLRQALERHKDRVVLGYNIAETETERGTSVSLLLPSSSLVAYPATRHPIEDDRLGYVSIWPDWDGVLRRASYRRSGAQIGNVLPSDIAAESLAARVLRKFGRADLIPGGFDPRLFRYSGPASFGYRPCPVGDVLSPKLWAANYQNGEFFRGKIVLIGPTAEIIHDTHRTPFGQMAGPEIHLNIIAAALHREFPTEPALPMQFMLIGLAGVVAWALCFLVSQPMKRLLVVALLTAGYGVLAGTWFGRAGTSAKMILVMTPLLVLILSSIVVLTYDYVLERLEKRRVRRTLERYVSKNVVRELLDNPQTFFNTLGGVRKPVTILFSDVRGFTTLTESADSAALVKQLNEYFEEMVALVFGHQGSLDKFVGDAVMAVWGNIVSNGPARDAQNAVATALGMKRSLAKLNEGWVARGIKPFAFGIGINHGEVIVGNLGSSEKMELTVIGDAVNLASRLEGLTKEYHLDLLLGENMAPLVGDQYLLRTVDCVQVKGKTKPVDVFTVLGDGAPQTVSMPVWLARYEEGVRQYRTREFAAAAAAFEECLRRQPDDFLSQMYLKRCQALIESPPDDSWNGVFVMTKK